MWRGELSGTAHEEIADFLQYGFPLGLDYSKSCQSTLKNHTSAFDYHKHIDKFISKENSLNGIAGPFTVSPFWQPVISPLMTAPEKPNSRRVCFDLTYGDHSVNNNTPQGEFLGEKYTYNFPKADEFERLLVKYGVGSLMWKTDLSRYYMQLPVNLYDYPLLCFIWRNRLFFYLSLPYGHRNSGMHGQKTTTAVVFIFKRRGIGYDGIEFDCLNYCDDSGGVDKGVRAWVAYYMFRALLTELGLVEAIEKSHPPATQMPYLGIQYCTETMTKTVTPERLIDLEAELDMFCIKTKASKTELESILHKLLWVSVCVKSSRVFVSRIISAMKKLKKNHHKLTLDAEILADIKWWRRFIREYSGVSLIESGIWTEPDNLCAGDACLVGGGAYIRNEYFSIEFPKFLKDVPIHILEFIVLIISCKVWGPTWGRLAITVYCDNVSVVETITHEKPKNKWLQACLRELLFLESLYSFRLRSVYISTKGNCVADFISRCHNNNDIQKYLSSVGLAHKARIEVPISMYKQWNSW